MENGRGSSPKTQSPCISHVGGVPPGRHRLRRWQVVDRQTGKKKVIHLPESATCRNLNGSGGTCHTGESCWTSRPKPYAESSALVPKRSVGTYQISLPKKLEHSCLMRAFSQAYSLGMRTHCYPPHRKLPEGVYLATSDDIQGLVAQGRTIQETLEIARDVAKKLLEATSSNGSRNSACGFTVRRLAPTSFGSTNRCATIRRFRIILETWGDATCCFFDHGAGQGGGFSIRVVILRCSWRPNTASALLNSTTESNEEK